MLDRGKREREREKIKEKTERDIFPHLYVWPLVPHALPFFFSRPRSLFPSYLSFLRTEGTCLWRRLNPWLPGRKHGERKSLPEPIFPYAVLKNRSLGPDVLDQSLPCADFEVYFYLFERAFIQADFRLWTSCAIALSCLRVEMSGIGS